MSHTLPKFKFGDTVRPTDEFYSRSIFTVISYRYSYDTFNKNSTEEIIYTIIHRELNITLERLEKYLVLVHEDL